MNTGFILLHRKIQDSWIFQRSDYYHWFSILLFKANFKDKNDYLFNGNLMDVKRGQFITSYNNLALEFPNSSIKKIRTFLKLLVSAEIIRQENLIKGTKITICNYDTYQGQGQDKGNQRATKGQPKGNNRKKEKKENNEKENIYTNQISFYNSELNENKNHALINDYRIFINYVFKTNESGEPMGSILGFSNQLKFKEYIKIHTLKIQHKKSVADILESMANDIKYTKNKKSLSRTIQNWLKNDF